MMIDTDKHEGVTPAPWIADGDDERGWVVITPKHDDPYAFIERRNDDGEVVSLSEADARLIADAPLLLAEVKRLREGIQDICNTGADTSFDWLVMAIKRLTELIE
jgi:hypothetical protein